MKSLVFLAVATFCVANLAAQPMPTKEQQIAAATLPLPEAYRAGAAVQSISADRKTTELRKGTNSMVCSIDHRRSETFYAYCFEKDYVALSLRGAQLHDELGKDGKPADAAAVSEALKKEIESGRLKVPAHPAVGFQMRGPAKAFDWNTNTASGEIGRWEMVMIPNATGASLYLPNSRPAKGGPWVMNEGTPMAHIMVEH
jgi:hypothetical protein